MGKRKVSEKQLLFREIHELISTILMMQLQKFMIMIIKIHLL